MTNEEVIAELQAGIKLLKKQRYTLLEENGKLKTENKRLREALEEIEAVSCGEEQIECDGVYDDSDGMQWIYKRIQALKGK